MATTTWKRLKESEFKEYGSMLPARVVLDSDDSDGTYRYGYSSPQSLSNPRTYASDFAAGHLGPQVRWSHCLAE